MIVGNIYAQYDGINCFVTEATSFHYNLGKIIQKLQK